MIKITINEKPIVVDSSNVEDLLREMEIKSPAIAVEVNQQLVPADRFSSTQLAGGDVVEIVTLVGGG